MTALTNRSLSSGIALLLGIIVTLYFSVSYAATPPYSATILAHPATYLAKGVEVSLEKFDDKGEAAPLGLPQSTDSDGKVIFDNLDPALYQIKTTFAGYEKTTTPFIVSDKDAFLNIILPSTKKYDVSLHISDVSAPVSLVGRATDQELAFYQDVTGSTKDLQLQEGNWLIEAKSTGKLPVALSLTVGPEFDENHNLLPPRKTDLTITFRAQDKTPVTSEKTLNCSSTGGSSLPFPLIVLGALFFFKRRRHEA